MRKFIYVSLLLIAGALGVLFGFRNILAQYKLQSYALLFHQRTGGELHVNTVRFTGIHGLLLKQVVVLTPQQDTLLHADSVEITLSLLKLFRLKSPLASIEVSKMHINLLIADSIANYQFVTKRKSDTKAKPVSQYLKAEELVQQYWSQLMTISEINFALYQTSLFISYKNKEERILFPFLMNTKGNIQLEMETLTKKTPRKWSANFTVDNDEETCSGTITSFSGYPQMLPFFDQDSLTQIGFKSISFSLQKIKTAVPSFSYSSKIDSLSVNYWRLASETIHVPTFDNHFTIQVRDNRFILDSISNFTLNRLKFNIGGSFQKKPSVDFDIALTFKSQAADFFQSLPTAIFSSFENFKASGMLDFNFRFKLDVNNPEDLLFESALTGKNFVIQNFGRENFMRINGPFMFAAYDKDRFVKSILIGNANPAFESLANISHYLQYAVLTSEDPSFFYHRGFIMDAFRESLIENIKKKRFVRGGSTISMQLVKNVFLSREKTISRKLQEILIVWLIENYQLVSKERMFEIYLNAIEWGPGIYGIKEAAHFYFLKTPAQLTLAESIFLASIIPHPKFYRYSVDTTGEIKPHLASYFKLISNRMLTKTWISPLDTFNLTNQLKLKGPSLNFNNPFFTAPADSLEDSTPDFFN